MNRIYSFYCDESGMFTGRDTSVICPLIVVDNVLDRNAMQQLWQKIYDGPWTEFHATQLKKDGKIEEVNRVVSNLVKFLSSTDGVYAVYAYHQSRVDVQFDFHAGALFHLLKWHARDILSREISQIVQNMDRKLNIEIKIYIAERALLNLIHLKNLLSEQIRNAIGVLVDRHMLQPDQISLKFLPYYLPVSDSPFMQVSDVLCNSVRAWLTFGNAEETAEGFMRGLKCLELSAELVNGKEMEKVCETLRQNYIGKKLVRKTVVKEVETRIEVSEKPWIEMLLSRMHKGMKKAHSFSIDHMSDLLEKYETLPENQRRMNLNALHHQAVETINVGKDREVGFPLVEIFYHMIELERSKEELSTDFLDECELGVADLYLTLHNHEGNFLVENPRIQSALQICEKYKQSMAHRLKICRFHNHLGISFQNVFQFEKAADKLYPIANYFENDQNDPFGGAGARAYEIGGLFGSYAQSLAFRAHCLFFTRGKRVLDDLGMAELYSMLADEHFEKDEDRERQIIYRAHFKMQQYILQGSKDSLDEAVAILNDPSKNERTVSTFLEFFPQREAITPAYRVHILLKRAYLANDPPVWLNDLVNLFLKHRGDIPGRHPFEQIFPYVIGLCRDGKKGSALLRLLNNIRFPPNIVTIIKMVLQAQLSFKIDGNVPETIIKDVEATVTADIQPKWQEYGLDRVLKAYRDPGKINRWHVGPMEILPFNYA